MGHKIIGFPVGINNPKYERNRLMFNLCFVCDQSMRTVQYEPVIRKLANYLIDLENECEFLFNENHKSKLASFLPLIKNQLNANKALTISVSKLFSEYKFW